MSDNRKYDVIVWGASGFTGRLVAEYLYGQYGLDGDLSWAVAARNKEKLKGVLNEMGLQSVPVVIADSNDRASLDAMTAQTKVVATTVGPYALYGDLLVESCVENGTHYCDLAGEVQWMRRTIDNFHEKAKANGTRIVHTCGFDSIPFDMGVYYLQREAKTRTGAYCERIKMRVKAMKGGFSGGTYASLGNVMAEAEKDRSLYKVLMNPYGLNPKGETSGPDKPDLAKPKYDKEIGVWMCPFIMAGINTKVVRRSNALMNYQYGKDMLYNEAMATGKGISGRLKAITVTGAMGMMMAGKSDSSYKKFINRFFPKPGEGPGKEERENGFYNLDFYGFLPSGDRIRAKVTGDKDPGYGSTSKILGESAVCLAKDGLTSEGGMLTPSYAMGDFLLDRLQNNAGMSFSIRG